MSQLPDKSQILSWIADNPQDRSLRALARAFGVRGAGRADLKRLLQELEAEGRLPQRRSIRGGAATGAMPPVMVLEVVGPGPDGELLAQPLDWRGEGAPPQVVLPTHPGEVAFGPGARVLARLIPRAEGDHDYEAQVIHRLRDALDRILGIFRPLPGGGGRIAPIERGQTREWSVLAGDTLNARSGDLVEAVLRGPRARLGLPRARITARLGDPSAPGAVSLIAIHRLGIPDAFPPAVLAEAAALTPVSAAGREDLTGLPLVTIDPPDARDRDDAVGAEPDPDPANPGGHILWVAIADVAAYVRPGSALDTEARLRGNSTYFPDRVVPMLPERLSADLCSLSAEAPRPSLVARMVVDSGGHKRSHRFHRAMIRPVATLSYAEVQAARDGRLNERCAPLLASVIAPLYAAHAVLARARAERQPLDLDLPERKIVLDEAGRVISVAFAERLEAHRLIEEFMVLANVAAAEELLKRHSPLLLRVHEEPDPEKLQALREVAQASGLALAKGQVLQTRHLNRLLAAAEGTESDQLINLATLRAMQQAYYSATNLGHFGLALRAYAHFTSPIRRYADLIVHRALIATYRWGDDGLRADESERLDATAEHISLTERRSMEAERETADRYLAAYLADRVGTEVTGRITGVQRFGLFVKLDETGADGLVPIRTLGHEYFRLDAQAQTLTGSDSGTVFGLGQKVLVRIREAAPVTGGLELELLEVEGTAQEPLSRRGQSVRPGKRGRRPPPRR